jgi:hypothetical protein
MRATLRFVLLALVSLSCGNGSGTPADGGTTVDGGTGGGTGVYDQSSWDGATFN